MAIAGDTITNAVITQLKNAFPTSKRYKERQESNVVRPCFFVQQLLLTQEKRMSQKYTRLYRIKITWLPLLNSATPRDDCDKMGEALLGAFRYLSLPWKNVVGRNAEFETVDNELQFTVEFTIFAQWQEDPGPDMQTLDVETGVKN